MQAGQFIQSKGGVVTAEQLAPYLDVTPDAMERVDGSVSESYMVLAPPPEQTNTHQQIFQSSLSREF